MDTVLQDLRYAFRGLRRTPGFVAVAILTLALGIGLATAVFTVAETLLLRRLPVQDQDRLVVLWGEARDQAFTYPLGLDDAREFARRPRSLVQIAFFSYYGAAPKPIHDGDRIRNLAGVLVSGEFFEVLGARPVLGRALQPADDVLGAAPVIVLSYRAWQQRFGGDARVTRATGPDIR